jgi:hypothetical protein
VTWDRSSYGEAYWRGYQRGVQSGHAAGYAEGVAVLDDAASALAQLRPSRTVGVAAARARMARAGGPSLTPHQIRAQAAVSWGLPVPADLTEPTTEPTEPTEPTGPATGLTGPVAGGPPAAAAPAVAELADDDDWAWQL